MNRDDLIHAHRNVVPLIREFHGPVVEVKTDRGQTDAMILHLQDFQKDLQAQIDALRLTISIAADQMIRNDELIAVLRGDQQNGENYENAY